MKNIPILRFPEFEELWNDNLFSDFYEFQTTNSYSRDNLNYEYGTFKNIHYGDIHTKFRTQFNVNNENVPYINEDIDTSKINTNQILKEGDLVLADASEDYSDIGKSIEVINVDGQKVVAGLHTLHAKSKNCTYVGYGGFMMKSPSVRKSLMMIAQGTKVLGISSKRVSQIRINIPSLPEQQKIADFLTAVDKRIELLEKKKTLLETYKKGVMKKIFNQEIRFKDDDGNDFPDWEEKRLEDVLNYEQPTKYLVDSTEYSDSYKLPVLTAGKSFILGYTNETFGIYSNLPTIIFDDFTTSFHYVDFEFKVKSSAMKMLTVTSDNYNLKFIFETMKTLRFVLSEHKRYWISEYSKLFIPIPSIEEQIKISNFSNQLDKQLELLQTQIDKSKIWKMGLLQKMFV